MRIDYAAVEPGLISRFRQLTVELNTTSIDARLRALVELRVSQINRCSYCIHVHTEEAHKLGDSRERLAQLSAWRDSPDFLDRERAALAWTEALTISGGMHDDEQQFDDLTIHFSEQEIFALGLVISLANFWNRMAGGFRRSPPATI
jgi:AhpD family alkylhydroperoxidase